MYDHCLVCRRRTTCKSAHDATALSALRAAPGATCSDSKTSRRLRTNIALAQRTFGENITPRALTLAENVLTFA